MNILTKKEMAEKLKVSEKTVDNYVEAGYLIPLDHPMGRNHGVPVRFLEEEVVNFFSRKPKTCSESKQPPEKR